MAGGVRLSSGAGFDGSHRSRAWLWLCGLLAVMSLALWTQPSARWDWQPGLAASQPWRWFSAAGVHWSGLHLGANLLGLALVARWGQRAGCGRSATLAWAVAWPLTQLGLLAQPDLLHYGGLSGVLHAGVAVGCSMLLVHARGVRRLIGGLVLAGLLAKLLLEAPWQGPLRHSPGWDIAIAPLAHATGAAAGLLCGLAAALWDRARP